MSTLTISKLFKEVILDDLIKLEKQITYDESASQDVANAQLLRYAFLFRLKTAIEKYAMDESEFFSYFSTNYGATSALLEAEIVYNKYFSNRLKMSYKDFLTKKSEEWYISDN